MSFFVKFNNLKWLFLSIIVFCVILKIGDSMDFFEKKMKEKIEQYSNKKYLDGYIKKEFLIDDGDADIFLHLRSRDELFDVRTMDEQIDLNLDIYDFIERKSSMLDSSIPINLHIVGLDLDSKEQGTIKHILKEHYAIELFKVQKKFNKCRVKIFKLIATGILSFLGYTYFFFMNDVSFFTEVMGFLFSFALWEGFDSLIYYYSDIKQERRDVTQNLLINVEFE